jgi:hypothetical protein
VVPWKYAFKGNLDSYRSRKRRKEREEDYWRQMMEQRLKEQDKKMQVEIERRLAVAISIIAQTGALPEVPLDPVISPSARKSSCASTEVALGACIEVAPGACTEGPEEPRAIEGVPMDDNQQYPVDFLCRYTPCELHKPFGNITMQVAYGSAFPHFPGQISHGMLIPHSYASVSVEEICQSQFEDLELDILGGDGERKLKDAVHGIILWPKRYTIIPQTEGSIPPIDPPQSRPSSSPRSSSRPSTSSRSPSTQEPLFNSRGASSSHDIDINPESPPKKQKKPMVEKQAPSKEQKTPQHHRKNRSTMKAHQKNRPTTKAYLKNCETTTEKTTTEETTVEKTT